MNLLIVGAPGAGKGTMSELLIDNYGITHVSTGDMLRKAIKDETPVGKIASACIAKGELVPDNVIHDLIVDWLSKDEIRNGFLFDGYPRTVAQAIDLADILVKLNKKIDLVINLDIEDDVLIKRITGRRLCPSCGEIYNIYTRPTKTDGVCDKCGANLTIRKDDTSGTLKERLNEYHQKTQPVIEYYEKMGLVKNIDADRDIALVFDDIKTILAGLK